MKKLFFLLLFPLWGLGGLFAAVTVTPLSVDYSAQKVTFSVSWPGGAAVDRVWVWIDLSPITGTSPGTFEKAVISGATATAGSIETVSGNTRGFYVTTNPSTVSATLSNATGKFNWCVYGSDFPPNAIDNSGGGYALRGSPPFIITTSAGTTEVNATTFSGGTITALTDATGYPGALCGKNGEKAGLLNCCVHGTTNCNGACRTNSTYTSNDGACTGNCGLAYIQQKDQCDNVIAPQYETYLDLSSCPTTHICCSTCIAYCATTQYKFASVGKSTTNNTACFCLTEKQPASGTTKPYGYGWSWNGSTWSVIWTYNGSFGYVCSDTNQCM